MRGFHVVVRPRGNPAVGQRNAMDMAIWPNLEDAMVYCVAACELYYFDRHFGISDCTIEPFEGMVAS